MTPSEVYLKAAELLEANGANGWSCWAIEDVLGVPRHDEGDPRHELVLDYENLFKPEGSDHWWGFVFEEDCGPVKAKECRILALCFMAAIAESAQS